MDSVRVEMFIQRSKANELTTSAASFCHVFDKSWLKIVPVLLLSIDESKPNKQMYFHPSVRHQVLDWAVVWRIDGKLHHFFFQ